MKNDLLTELSFEEKKEINGGIFGIDDAVLIIYGLICLGAAIYVHCKA